MANTTTVEAGDGADLRHCPTRIDRAPVRIAQRIQVALCQDRQRGLYHKCFSCEHANGRLLLTNVSAPALVNGRS